MRTILLSGLRKSDELVFSSLLSLLSNNTEEEWAITSNGNSDIAVVDVDNPNGVSLARNLEKCGRQVIRVTTHSGSDENGLWLHKPVRSTDILKCIAVLNQLQASESSATNEDSTTNHQGDSGQLMRLRRWPSRDILRSFPESNRLCAVLIRRPLTFSQAEKLSKLSTESLQKFMSLCKDQKCLQVSAATNVTQSPPISITPSRSNLFSKLRHKLMSKH